MNQHTDPDNNFGSKPSNEPVNEPGNEQEKTYWLDKPGTLRLIIAVLIIACIGLFAVDFFYHKHGHFEFEQWYGFYAWYGFLSYCLIVLSAKQMRKLIGRKEDYYESEDPDSNFEKDNDQP